MREWEYRVEPVANISRTESVLNDLAGEGWRLRAVIPVQNHGPWIFLERRVAGDDAPG